jgi:hypothetical protein
VPVVFALAGHPGNGRILAGLLEPARGEIFCDGMNIKNDIVDFEDQMKEEVSTGMLFLTVLGGHIANSILMKYIFLLDDSADSHVFRDSGDVYRFRFLLRWLTWPGAKKTR